MNNKAVEDFYDRFSTHQLKVGINERIISLYKRIVKLGLNSSSNVLELGSGIGSFTYLLAKKVKLGHIESVDISPKSIELLKSKIPQNNVLAFAADVVSYTPRGANFDFITLLDVIEHIPLEEHGRLFANISSIMDENTRLLINIPNPKYIEYGRIHNPEALQLIDQPIPLNTIAQNIAENGLSLHFFETYGIWAENEYQFMIIKKNMDFEEVKFSETRDLGQKILHRLGLLWNKIYY